MSRLTGLLHTVSPPIPTVRAALASYEKRSKTGQPSGLVEYATFANGCFWGTQHIFDSHYGPKNGILESQVGYIGGKDGYKDPNYRQVCSGSTGFAEACRLKFDPEMVSYAELVEFFYRTHDPTTVDRQGNDRGTQYRSAIFTHSPDQEEIAITVTEEVQNKYFTSRGKRIVTEINTASTWYTAEEYHQKYLGNNPNGYQCSTHVLHW